jgi:3-methyladenine DNA glycosylase AlkD
MRVNNAIAELDASITRLRSPNVSSVREVRKELSRQLRTESPVTVLAIANRLVERDGGWDRFVASELVGAHRATMEHVTAGDLRKLGEGIDSWEDVDVFASLVTGPAWREGRITDAEIARWARSKDMWWRRTAIVSTVPLNNRTRGGNGDARRTLAVCRMLLDDREPLIVKAVSWALRELSKRDAATVEKFIAANDAKLAPLVRREVRAKLSTGLKNPRLRRSTR